MVMYKRIKKRITKKAIYYLFVISFGSKSINDYYGTIKYREIIFIR